MKMRKGGVYLVIACLFVISSCLSVSSYTFRVGNISINEDYAVGEGLSGIFFLNLTNVSADSFFSSEFGETGIREVFANDGYELSCEVYNCTGLYSKSDSGVISKQITTSVGGKALGLYLIGEQVFVNDFGLNIASEFGEYDSVPFFMKIANDYSWSFDSPSENWENLRGMSTGCFDSSAVFTNKVIDSFGYCEQVNLSASRSYYLKANISGSGGIEDFKMSLNKDGEELESCDFSISYANYSSDAGCVVEFLQQIESGAYDVCISSHEDLSDYTIKREVSGGSCGYYKNPDARTSDYSLYVLTPKYSSFSGDVGLPEDFSIGASDAINYYLSVVYPDGCSGGCTVPIVFYGNNIILNLSDIRLRHDTQDGPELVNKINEVRTIMPKIDYSDFVSLDAFNWVTNSIINKNVSVYLQDGSQKNKLFDFRVNVHESPLVRGVYPINPPAGIDVYFYADVLYNFSRLEWNFGDGSSLVNTNSSFVLHSYNNVSQLYNISITAYGQNYSMTKSFTVETISPENYLNTTFDAKRNKLMNLSNRINLLPVLYKEFVKGLVDISGLIEQLNQIDIDRVQAYSPEQFLEVAQGLSNIIVPYSIEIGERKIGSVSGDFNSINPSYVGSIFPGNYSDFDEYKREIVGWQSRNVGMQVIEEKLRLYYENNEVEDLISIYTVKINSSADETSYFIIQESSSNLHFASGISGTDIDGEAAYFEILAGESLVLNFFVSGSEDVTMFVSPKLSSLFLGNEIGICNFNKVCQKDLGEDYKNCRSDCKPVWPVVLWLVLVLIFILAIYTLLQIWYKIRYEKYLFKDRTYLFNLIAFINNSKLKRLSHGDIYSALYQKNWSGEQISYAVKRAEGRNVGMYEIIPVDRILAYFAMKQAEKVKNQEAVAPVNPPVLKNNLANRQFPNGGLQSSSNMRRNSFRKT